MQTTVKEETQPDNRTNTVNQVLHKDRDILSTGHSYENEKTEELQIVNRLKFGTYHATKK